MQLKTVEDITRKFNNDLGFALQPSTDTMNAVRLARTKLDSIIKQDRANIRAGLKDWITKNEKELSDPYPFDSKYSYCDFVSASDLEEFIDTLLPGDVSK